MDKATASKRRLALLALIAACLMACSCRTAQDLTYITDAQRDSAAAMLTNYSAIILPGDDLSIEITANSPELLMQYYKRASLRQRSGDVDERDLSSQEFQVNRDGNIDIPLLGFVKAAGLSLDTLAVHIARRFEDSGFVADPIVVVRRTNFRVTVVGEVANPRQLHIEGNRLTIFEALALTGDITINGQRDNIIVMREIDGQQTFGTIDLTSKSIFDSPYYYLQQNDVVYVEPNDKKKRRAYRNPNIPSYISIGLSLMRIASLGVLRIIKSEQRYL